MEGYDRTPNTGFARDDAGSQCESNSMNRLELPDEPAGTQQYPSNSTGQFSEVTSVQFSHQNVTSTTQSSRSSTHGGQYLPAIRQNPRQGGRSARGGKSGPDPTPKQSDKPEPEKNQKKDPETEPKKDPETEPKKDPETEPKKDPETPLPPTYTKVLVIPQNAQKEDPSDWLNPDPLDALDKTEREIRNVIDGALRELTEDKDAFRQTEISSSSTPWSVWTRVTDGKEDLEHRTTRIPLTALSSIDPTEVSCPDGMRLIGVGLGPWRGEGWTEDQNTINGRPNEHMSIKLLCKDASGTTSVYGNAGRKVTEKRMSAGTPEEPQTVKKFKLSIASTTLTWLMCDSRPTTYESFLENQESPTSTHVRSISSLKFYSFLRVKEGKPVDVPTFYNFLPIILDPEHGRIEPTSEAIGGLSNNISISGSLDFFRSARQLTPSNLTFSGIDRLYYDTSIISYNDWQVTGVQMYLRDKDTIALNVRFQNPDPEC